MLNRKHLEVISENRRVYLTVKTELAVKTFWRLMGESSTVTMTLKVPGDVPKTRSAVKKD